MAIVHEGSAPYAPVAHVLQALDHYREKGPDAFSKELLMRIGFPEAYARRTMTALKLLDLIDRQRLYCILGRGRRHDHFGLCVPNGHKKAFDRLKHRHTFS